jgi:uncharacterized membrane protein YeaQ/YmgE (transglycosylase-associated protein family)
MMSWIKSAVVGLICGAAARFLLPGSDAMGLLMTMVVGLVGAWVGTGIGHATGRVQKSEAAGWLWSVIGAIAVLLILRYIM